MIEIYITTNSLSATIFVMLNDKCVVREYIRENILLCDSWIGGYFGAGTGGEFSESPASFSAAPTCPNQNPNPST